MQQSWEICSVVTGNLWPGAGASSQSVQSLSRVQLFATLWTAAHQASLSITNSQRLLTLMSIELVMSSNHLILCPPLLLSPSREERKEELLEAMHLREPRAINKANVYKALESQAGIKIAKRTINNLRYADDTILMAEIEKELKTLLMRVEEESEESWLKTQHSKN